MNIKNMLMGLVEKNLKTVGKVLYTNLAVQEKIMAVISALTEGAGHKILDLLSEGTDDLVVMSDTFSRPVARKVMLGDITTVDQMMQEYMEIVSSQEYSEAMDTMFKKYEEKLVDLLGKENVKSFRRGLRNGRRARVQWNGYNMFEV